jgi:hypothetical protein
MAVDEDRNTRQNPRLSSHEIGFARAELIDCKGCGKPNAPNRSSCLYCGAGLDGVGITKFEIREPESWENGFNVVLVSVGNANADRAAAMLGSLLRADKEPLKQILTSGKLIPLARVESDQQAIGIGEKLDEFGVRTMIVADVALQPNLPPKRLRSIAFDANELRLELFSSGEIRKLGSNELALIVPGLIIETRTESVEQRKLRGTKTVSEAEMSTDEPLLDIYSRDDSFGWRIPATGFDFSSLGKDKTLIVSENMKRLALALAEFCPAAKVVNDYTSVRSDLERSWPSESKKDFDMLGIRRKELTKKLTTNNSLQFTKYSRLQWQLYEKKV